FAAGYFGVSLFFVISGFIMVITTKKSDGSLSYVKTFMIKRFMRIWPAYFIATIVSFMLLAGPSWFANWDNLIYLARSMLLMPSGTAPA
ncbi:acyltransferase family protein, partial [Citrobacter youngae]